jgi:ketosteroid isomerase-like protein
MKKLILVLVFGASLSHAFGQARPNIFAPPPTASGPVADLVNSIVMAFNNHDTAALQKLIAPDAVWLDEDGHHLIAMVWMNRLMAANPQKKLTISNLRVSSWDNTGWAAFNYVMEGGNMVKGTNSMLFKKTGNDWQIVLVHGAVDTKIAQH